MTTKPRSVDIYSFNVGFGDCTLLQFKYAGGVKRNVLIDFGSTSQPNTSKNRPKSFMTKVAEEIKRLCDGSLEIVVATHRHKDHIDGFRTNAGGTAPGDVIKTCNPQLVLQPWTEHPRARTRATQAPGGDDDSRAFAGALEDMDAYAQRVFAMAKSGANMRAFNSSQRQALSFLGENNITNKSAVENLMEMGAKKAQYLNFGKKVNDHGLLPGVTIDVLGPPTLKQSKEIQKQRSRHETEYWHLQANIAKASLPSAEAKGIFPAAGPSRMPPWTKWGAQRLAIARRESLFNIVRRLDDQMNNTSLILLFSVGSKALLFPGDAQWENWSYALSDDATVEKLRGVDLYKPGHHGSLNATPKKSLWDEFKNRGPESKRGRMTTVLSTKHGVHGHSKATAVPRSTLVKALTEDTHFHNTEDIKIKKTTKPAKFHSRVTIRF